MKKITLLCTLIALALCDYKKLSKYSSVSVKPDTKVYLDLNSFKTGDLISLEINMDLFFGGSTSSYEFQIDQVPATTYYDQDYWDGLRTVINRNVTCSSVHYCKFSLEEIKREGNNYIYIIVPSPFSDFYSFWGNKIKISNTGGLSSGAIAGIVIGILVPILLIVGLVTYFRRRNKNNNVPRPLINYQNNPPTNDVAYNSGPVYQPSTFQQPIYQQPQTYQQPIPLQPYQPGAIYQNQ